MAENKQKLMKMLWISSDFWEISKLWILSNIQVCLHFINHESVATFSLIVSIIKSLEEKIPNKKTAHELIMECLLLKLKVSVSIICFRLSHTLCALSTILAPSYCILFHQCCFLWSTDFAFLLFIIIGTALSSCRFHMGLQHKTTYFSHYLNCP